MKPYFSQLQVLANELNVPLLDAFARAEVPTSTYYRSVNGTTEMRYDTACRIYKAIYEEHSAVSKLRSANQDAGQSKTRKETKSTRLS